jgi:hypothetical protein
MAQLPRSGRTAGLAATVAVLLIAGVVVLTMRAGAHPTHAGNANSNAMSPGDAAKASFLASVSAANEAQKRKAPRAPKATDSVALNTVVARGCIPPPPGQGLTNNRQSTLNKGILAVTSGWTQTIQASLYAVYAGAKPDDESLGEIVVQTFGPCGQETAVDLYESPDSQAGPFTIVSADAHVLKLATTSGKTFTFDVDARRFG